MNEKKTPGCTGLAHNYRGFHYLPVLAIMWVFFQSCSSGEDKANRPSPFVQDSTLVQGQKIKIEYSSPRVKERVIWGDLVPYDEVWRTGANEATVFETSVDLLMSDGLLKKGKYALFTLPGETDWVIIFNKKWDQWGAYSYDEKDDALRMTLKPLRGRDFAERMTFSFEEDSLAFHWEYLQFSIPLQPAN